MATIRKWSNVQVALQSALASALTITGITKASPGVVTYTGTDPSNGDYVLVTAQGMSQVNNRVFRVANVNGAANTFELEGENTTDYDTFSSGQFQVITFGTTVTGILGLQSSGGDSPLEDNTTIHDAVRVETPGLPNNANFSLEMIWDPADAGLVAMVSASKAQLERAMRFTWPDGAKYLFTGWVSASGAPGGNAQQRVTTAAQITARGVGTFYTT